MDRLPQQWVSREAALTVRTPGGESRLSFLLSLGLFSSSAVDTGTRLLLRQVIRTVPFTELQWAVDMGCGTGVLAVALKKVCPHLRVLAVDRSALALAFTAENARRNEVSLRTAAGLDLLLLADAPASKEIFTAEEQTPLLKPFVDEGKVLIVSNIPAKAGDPVLQRIFTNAAALLAAAGGGIFSFVIVSPLFKSALEHISEAGLTIIETESSKGYSICSTVLSPGSAGEAQVFQSDFPGAYGRNIALEFTHRDLRYTLTTVYGIPGFDSVPRDAALALRTWEPPKQDGRSRRMLFWNPKQGHTVLPALQAIGTPVSECALAGDDLLALLASARAAAAYCGQLPVRIIHLPGIGGLAEETLNSSGYNLVCIEADPVARDRLYPGMDCGLPKHLSPASEVLLHGSSADTGRIITGSEVFRLVRSRKTKGFRAAVLRLKD